MNASKRKKLSEGRLGGNHRLMEHGSSPTDLMLRTDLDLRITYVSPGLERCFGTRREKLLGKKVGDTRKPDYDPQGALPEKCRCAIASGREVHNLFELKNRFFLTRVIPEFSEGGDVCSLVCLTEDITERKIADDRLRESQRQYEALVHSIDGIVWELDCESYAFTFVSNQAERILGYPVAQWLDDPDFWVNHIHPDDREWAPKFCREATQRGEDHQFEYRMIASDGRIVWLRDLVTVAVANGLPVQVRGVIVDITARKKEEQFRLGESRILEMIASSEPLPKVLTSLVALIETQSAGLYCSILLLDEDGIHFRHGASPSLPASYTKALDGLAIGPTAGSCGTGMYWGKTIVVTDILQDPLWSNYRDLASAHGLRACWSTPIVAADRTVLGSFAMYYREARTPSHEDMRLLERATQVAGIAIERDAAQEMLRRSEQRYRALVTASARHVWRTDEHGEIFYATSAWLELTGAREEQIGSLDWLNVIHPDDRSEFERRWQAALKTRMPFKHEFRVYTRHGEYRTFEAIAVPIFEEDGRVREWIWANDDITKRKVAEQARTESEVRNQALLRTIPDSMFLLSSEGVFLDCHAANLDDLLFPPEHFLGKNMRDVLPPELTNEFAAGFLRAAESKQPQTVEYRLDLNGCERHWEARMVDCQGDRILVIFREITQRKLAEDSLRGSEERFRLVALATRDAIYDWDFRKKEVWRNEAYERLFAGDEQSVREGEGWWQKRIHPRDRRRVLKSLTHAFKNQFRFWSEEYAFRRIDNSYAIVVDRGYILYDDSGQRLRMIGAITDITDRRLAEQALSQSEDELRRSHEQIRELAGKLITAQEEERRRISRELHDDLSQKVAALAFHISRVKRQLSASAQSLASQLDETLQGINELAGGIRQLSHQLHPAVLERFGLAKALSSFVAEFSQSEHMEIKLAVPDKRISIPHDVALCLYRVAQESLRNVVRHSGGRSAEVSLFIEDSTITLLVRDTGCGFDTRRARRQRGLGLASMEERVRLVRGTMKVSTRRGAGTTVLAIVPFKENDQA